MPEEFRDALAGILRDEEPPIAVVRENLRGYGYDPDALADRGRKLAASLLGRRKLDEARERRLALLAKLGAIRERLVPYATGPGPVGAAAYRALETLDERDGYAALEDERLLAELSDELSRLEALTKNSADPLEFALYDLAPRGFDGDETA